MKPLAILALGAAIAALGSGSALARPFGSYVVPDRLAPAVARVTISLPLRNKAELETLIRLQSDPRSPAYGHFLTPAQFRARYGPGDATFRAVAASLRAKGLNIDDVSAQAMHASGTARALAAAFGTRIEARRFGRETHARLVATSKLHLDAVLRDAGAVVIGLQAIPEHRRFSARARMPLNRYGPDGAYWFTDLKEAYAYPSNLVANGKGATIGILMSNDVRDGDLNGIFNHEKYTLISGAAIPKITRRRVDGGAPFDKDLSFEPSLDVQQSLGSAPGANLDFYNVPDLSDQSIYDGYSAIVTDDTADVISSSFGLCELFYTPAYNDGEDYTSTLTMEQQLFMQGNAQGQTFVASSGDNAGLPCPDIGYFNGNPGLYVPGVSDPASDPYVTGVGGTNLVTAAPPSPVPSIAPLNAGYVRESEFGDPLVAEDPYEVGGNATLTNGIFGSGSGVSALWTKPAAQQFVNTGSTMRAVPDISMEMGGCPEDASSCGADDSATVVEVAGSLSAVIGTSSSSPEFAGLLAVRIGALKHRLGNVNAAIYQIAVANASSNRPQLHTSIAGYNGVVSVSAQPRIYNPIVGVGTPIAEFAIGFPYAPRAGIPQTITNP